MNNLSIKIQKYIFFCKLLFDRKKLHYLHLTNNNVPDYIANYNWSKNNFSIPYPRFVKEKLFEKYNIDNCIWIETGTYYGETAKYLSNFSKMVYTLEPSIEIYESVIHSLKDISNIKVFNKSSEEGFEDVLSLIENQENVCFWLDGHYSEGNTFLGTSHSPIQFELNILEKHLHRLNKVNILIDDFRLFQEYESENVYPTKNYLVNWANDNSLNFEIEADIFIIIKE